MSREFDFEEHYHNQDRKQHRKEKRYAQEKDRSKFKKTDQEKKEPLPIDPKWKKGRILSITGEGAWVDLEGERLLASVRGILKKEKMQAKNLVAVGDVVYLNADNAIVHIQERYSFLARTDISGKKEQLIAVNVDQAIIIVSLIHPPLKPALVDRYLIAAEKGNIHPIIVINKIDLLDSASETEKSLYEEFITEYEKLGVPILSLSSQKQTGIEALKALLKDRTSVFSGQSGVGKSSLLNACYGLELKTGDLAQKTAKGTHTTTVAELIALPQGGYCVDTPGIRSFGLWKLKKEEVIAHFKDFGQFDCKYPDCAHINEPSCGVQKALETGDLSPLRYESYCTLFDEATGGADHWSKKKEPYEFD